MPEVNQPHSIDDILTTPADAPIIQQVTAPPSDPESTPQSSPVEDAPSQDVTDPYSSQKNTDELGTEPEISAQNSTPIDEYGNPVEKPKMYSEDEVQRILRDRLSRVRNPQQEEQVRQAVQDFQPDPDSDESWQKQLRQFIRNELTDVKKEETNRHWQEQESRRQADFEAKFTAGMNKYTDFHAVVSGKPITDTMMLATRSLENPAAFLYAASKLQAAELTRISQIADPYVQATEVGRLHEKMIKEQRKVSQSSRPLDPPKADMPMKNNNQPSLEQRIDQYGKAKRK